MIRHQTRKFFKAGPSSGNAATRFARVGSRGVAAIVSLLVLLWSPVLKGESPAGGPISQAAALLPNHFKTFSVETNSTAQAGACTVQTADRAWTVGQGVLWDVTKPVKAGEKEGKSYKFRVRVKVKRTGEVGAAFRFGFMGWNEDWSGDGRFVTIQAKDTRDGEWQWYESPQALVSNEAFARGQSVYVLPEKNPDNVTAVYVDVFELTPLGN